MEFSTILLWLVVGMIASFMISLLVYGWLRNNNWVREAKLKKKQMRYR